MGVKCGLSLKGLSVRLYESKMMIMLGCKREKVMGESRKLHNEKR